MIPKAPRFLRTALLVAVAAPWALRPGEASAQAVPPSVERSLQNLSYEQIRQRLLNSGLSQTELRDRLRKAGYDPSLVDRYFDTSAEGDARSTEPQDAEFLGVMQSLGLSLRQQPDSLRAFDLDTPGIAEDTPDVVPGGSMALPIFGRDVFRRRSTEFRPVLTGPVGPSYRLGPGDELVLVLTGDVELAYRLDVTREGYVVIPDVGQLSVNGLTLGDLTERLFDRLGQVYSGVRRDASATTRFFVSLGALRTNQVYVVGEVERPGAYQVSSVATLLEALYAAGGPRETGSFREVSIRRGGQAAGAFDLYRYLTAGETPTELRLEEGDVVFVPPIGAQVALRGEVIREGRYEVRPGEGLGDLLRFAGGLRPGARADLARVERILPAEAREQGRDRVAYDVDPRAALDGAMSFPLMAGDDVEVLQALEQLRGWVSIAGAVYRPGVYEAGDGPTLERLVDRAGGALPDVFEPVAHVSRLDVTTGARSLIRISLAEGDDLALREFDQVTLFGRDSLLVSDSVAVYGFVKYPGKYAFAEGTTPDDMVLQAGGFIKGADPRWAEIARAEQASQVGTSASVTVAVPLVSTLPYAGQPPRAGLPPLQRDLDAFAILELAPGDEVYIRPVPGFQQLLRVEVVGEVRAPGTYVLEQVGERLSSVLNRAGGVNRRGSAEGFRLLRDGVAVGVSLERALARPGAEDDIPLMDGDRLVVPTFDGTVLVTGAVQFTSRVVYRDGMSLDDAIAAAGGFDRNAEKKGVSIEYANGARATVKRFLGMTVSTPDIRPGSTVFVPAREESETGFDWNSALSRVLAVASTMATVVIAVRR